MIRCLQTMPARDPKQACRGSSGRLQRTACEAVGRGMDREKVPSGSMPPMPGGIGRCNRTGPSKRQFSKPAAMLRQSTLPMAEAVDPRNLVCRQSAGVISVAHM